MAGSAPPGWTGSSIVCQSGRRTPPWTCWAFRCGRSTRPPIATITVSPQAFVGSATTRTPPMLVTCASSSQDVQCSPPSAERQIVRSLRRAPVFLMTDKEIVMSMSTVELASYSYPSVRERLKADALPSDTPGLRPEETFLPWRFAPIDEPPPFSPYGG